jgi:hypothetical protein
MTQTADTQARSAADTGHEYGPWNPGIQSQIPLELRHLCTIFHPENVFTSVAAATELQLLTDFPLWELVTFRPRRLLLHELMIRVMADFSVPDGSRIGDLGINFREMTRVLFERYLEPEMPSIIRAYEELRQRLTNEIGAALTAIVAEPAPPRPQAGRSPIARMLARMLGGRSSEPARPSANTLGWGPAAILECEHLASSTDDALKRVGYRALARVMSALFTTHGRAWGTPDLIVSVATGLASNIHGSDVIGRMIEPILRRAAAREGYVLLPHQEEPVVINTKGPSASGKSTLRPLQKKLAGNIGVQWRDFALISPDIWRKQLLDYASLGAAFKYAGAFTSEELQIIDHKLDRYMALKHERGGMAHLLIDRFRFDSFAPDSAEAGSNLLTRFGHSVYLFFVITPPEQLVERAWTRGLEFGRYKAVDDTLAHSVEAYTGMPAVFFTWARRTDKRIHIELLDNSVRLGELPRTVAFGTNYTLNVLDVGKMLDIERYGRIDVDAPTADDLYPDRAVLAPEHSLGFLRRCVETFREVNFAQQATGRLYLRIESGVVTLVDREELRKAVSDPAICSALRLLAPGAFDVGTAAANAPQYVTSAHGTAADTTLGHWGYESSLP